MLGTAFGREMRSLFHPQAQEQWRDAVREKATDLTMKEALCRILPVPCKEHHTAVALMPRAPRLQQLLATLCKAEQSLSAESKVNVFFFTSSKCWTSVKEVQQHMYLDDILHDISTFLFTSKFTQNTHWACMFLVCRLLWWQQALLLQVQSCGVMHHDPIEGHRFKSVECQLAQKQTLLSGHWVVKS